MRKPTHYVVNVTYFVLVEPGQDARDASKYVLDRLLDSRLGSPQSYKTRPATKREIGMPETPRG